jgi:hypothetical protein
MGKPDPHSTAPLQHDEHANAPEAVAVDQAISSDIDQAHEGLHGTGAHIDAEAVAALQGLGSDPSVNADLPGDLGLSGDHDLFAALHGLDGVGNIDHALDQLTSSTDLFDVPPLDFGDHHQDSTGS